MPKPQHQVTNFLLQFIRFGYYFGAMERRHVGPWCSQWLPVIAFDKGSLHGGNSKIRLIRFLVFAFHGFCVFFFFFFCSFIKFHLPVHWCKGRSQWAHRYCSVLKKALHLLWGLHFFPAPLKKQPLLTSAKILELEGSTCKWEEGSWASCKGLFSLSSPVIPFT